MKRQRTYYKGEMGPSIVESKHFQLGKLVRNVKTERKFFSNLKFMIFIYSISTINNYLLYYGLNLAYGNIYVNAFMISFAEVTGLVFSCFFDKVSEKYELYF